MFKRFAAAWLLRRLLREHTRLADAVEALATAHTRLADHFAPILAAVTDSDRATIRADTGVSHIDVDDVELAESFIARSQAATGHTPDEDEILIYLGDERTRDLGERLAAREGELARLAEARR